ncbi:unnamed protein product [Cochlearia groenlandica]
MRGESNDLPQFLEFNIDTLRKATSGFAVENIVPEHGERELLMLSIKESLIIKPESPLKDSTEKLGLIFVNFWKKPNYSEGAEANLWSIGVIAYILLCGSRAFWARTESGIFRVVLKAKPNFEEAP